jgi:hypothetical protein
MLHRTYPCQGIMLFDPLWTCIVSPVVTMSHRQLELIAEMSSTVPAADLNNAGKLLEFLIVLRNLKLL